MPTKPPTFRPPGWTPAPDKRPEAHDPYYGTQAWRRLRAIVLERDGYRCTALACGTPGRGIGAPLIVDHVVERRKGGADHLSNLRTLCPTLRQPSTRPKGGRGIKSVGLLGVRPVVQQRAFFREFRKLFLFGGEGVGPVDVGTWRGDMEQAET